MTNKDEISSNPLGIRDVLIKTTIIYHFIPMRLAKFKKPDNAKCWKENGEIGNLLWSVEWCSDPEKQFVGQF